jgi:hypothetical protein
LYILIIGFCTNSLLVKTRVKSTLYTPILYWSRARHWGQVIVFAIITMWRPLSPSYSLTLLPSRSLSPSPFVLPTDGISLHYELPVSIWFYNYAILRFDSMALQLSDLLHPSLSLSPTRFLLPSLHASSFCAWHNKTFLLASQTRALHDMNNRPYIHTTVDTMRGDYLATTKGLGMRRN